MGWSRLLSMQWAGSVQHGGRSHTVIHKRFGNGTGVGALRVDGTKKSPLLMPQTASRRAHGGVAVVDRGARGGG